MKTLQRNHSVAPIYMLKSYKKGQINHTGPTTRHRDFLCSWYFLSAAKEIPRVYATQKFIKVYIRFLHRTAQRTISIPLTTSHSFSLRSTLVLSSHIRPVPQIACAIQTFRLPFHPQAFRPFSVPTIFFANSRSSLTLSKSGQTTNHEVPLTCFTKQYSNLTFWLLNFLIRSLCLGRNKIRKHLQSMRYLKFSPTFKFLRRIRRVDWQIATDISDKPSGSVFWVS